MSSLLPQEDEVFADDGYIRVYQDVRGKYKSEGNYVMTWPARGPLNRTSVDESTDAWDTIDWLVKNTPETNGRVGMIGVSYDGFEVAMALLDPHPALRVAAAESPMIDGWMGDDWFHYGAFRQVNIDYFVRQTSAKGDGENVARGAYDDFERFLSAGSAGSYARTAGLGQLPWWQRLTNHPSYDPFWRQQAVDSLLVKRQLKVPAMWVGGLWDQEDIWGAAHSYAALKARGTSDQLNQLVLGPWFHGQMNSEGDHLGPLRFAGDTSLQFRREILKPFFDKYLKDTHRGNAPSIFVYDSGKNHWDHPTTWPLACETGCPSTMTAMYLQADFTLGFGPPSRVLDAFDAYIADPSKPVPFAPPPREVLRSRDVEPLVSRGSACFRRPYRCSDIPNIPAHCPRPRGRRTNRRVICFDKRYRRGLGC
jgi:uncharacterized protein